MSTEDKTERLHIHIAGLEATLSKRNETIRQLREKLDAAENSPLMKQARDVGYKDGWMACASKLMETTRQTAAQLGTVNRSAWSAYLEGERMGRAES